MNIAETKKILTTLVLEIAEKRLQEIDQSSRDAQDRANEAEGAMQSRYDTFKEEGQYLAGGLKIRAMELGASVLTIRRMIQCESYNMFKSQVSINSLVSVEFENGDEQTFFVLPVLGGERVDDDVLVITPHAPVGRSLINKEEGDEFTYTVGGKKRSGEIIRIV